MSASALEASDQFSINYGEGLTPTEQVLKYFGERSFLRFWSHANPHATPAQELCDLLVVCNDYVIIFSDKSIDFQIQKDEQTAWRRWYRSAIDKSVRQLNGAARHLFALQTTIYKDRACTVPLGIPMPSLDRAKIYRVAVVSRSNEMNDNARLQPFLEIDGALTGNRHVRDGATPFRIGDVSPDTSFVHVIDLAGLWVVLSELDTITDFARYLEARKRFIREQPHNSAGSEWAMVTRYLLSYTDDGDPLQLDSANPGYTRLNDGEWQAASTKAAFAARKDANRESYLWDHLIEQQAKKIEQQSFEFSTYTGIQDAERVVRHMALEPRLYRRVLVNAWKQACLIAEPEQVSNIRTIPHRDSDGTTYVFFTLKQPEEMPNDQYRHRRRGLLEDFVLASLIDVPTSKVIIGFGSELGQVPRSFDLLHFNADEDANQDTLQADVKAKWDFKKRFFGDATRKVIDEWDIPPAN